VDVGTSSIARFRRNALSQKRKELTTKTSGAHLSEVNGRSGV